MEGVGPTGRPLVALWGQMSVIRSWFARNNSGEEAPRVLIAGLGNPGAEYARSRHNIGFQVLDLLAERHHVSFDRHQKRARVAVARMAGRQALAMKVVLAKPMTYMNASGEALGPLAAFYKIAPPDVMVIYDDLDLPIGRIRVRASGSSGGQKGMQSIIRALGSDAFPRLRVGIGRPPGTMDPADYVLRPFSQELETEMVLARARAAEAVELWLTQGIEAAMNRYNHAP
jgi:peptidyl-tRNA hydrolase, PTH1 family